MKGFAWQNDKAN